MHNPPIGPRTLHRFAAGAALLLILIAGAHGRSKTMPAQHSVLYSRAAQLEPCNRRRTY